MGSFKNSFERKRLWADVVTNARHRLIVKNDRTNLILGMLEAKVKVGCVTSNYGMTLIEVARRGASGPLSPSTGLDSKDGTCYGCVYDE